MCNQLKPCCTQGYIVSYLVDVIHLVVKARHLEVTRAPVVTVSCAIDLICFIVELVAGEQQVFSGWRCATEVDRLLLIGGEGELVDVVPQLGWKCLKGGFCHVEGGAVVRKCLRGRDALAAVAVEVVAVVVVAMVVMLLCCRRAQTSK